MNCRNFEEQLVMFAELSTEEKAQLETHLAGCASCASMFDSVSAAEKIIKRAGTVHPVLQDPVSLTDSIMGRIVSQRPAFRNWLDFSFLKMEVEYPKFALAAVSIFFVSFFGFELMSSQSGTNQPSLVTVAKPVVLNKEEFRRVWKKNKSHGAPLLTSSCINPFRLNRVDAACLRQRMGLPHPLSGEEGIKKILYHTNKQIL